MHHIPKYYSSIQMPRQTFVIADPLIDRNSIFAEQVLKINFLQACKLQALSLNTTISCAPD